MSNLTFELSLLKLAGETVTVQIQGKKRSGVLASHGAQSGEYHWAVNDSSGGLAFTTSHVEFISVLDGMLLIGLSL